MIGAMSTAVARAKKKMTFKHGKLDKRFTGYPQFTRYVELYQPDQFCEIRNWCWEQWGPSSEYMIYKEERNPAWCWISDQYRQRVLFTGEKEYAWFLLKWVSK